MAGFDVLAEAARLGREGVAAALVTIVRVQGSTPRQPGAHMLVRADGGLVGTIGGGKVELEATEAALRVARGEAPAGLLERHLVRDLAMCCGGAMELWIEPLDGARWKAIEEALRRRRARRASALVTALDTVGGGGKDVRPDDPCLRTRRPRVDADGDRLVEPVLPADRLVLFGAGHVAAATAPLAARVGFEVIVCDEDPAFASRERFPDASAILHTFDVRDVAAELAPFGPSDHAVVLTRDHAIDQAVLEQLLVRDDLTYLGLIGSRGKVGRFRKRLEAKGLVTEERWARLHAPVGLDIGAETPEEIAVAIVAQLIRVRRPAAPAAAP